MDVWTQSGDATYTVRWLNKSGVSIKDDETRHGTQGMPVSIKAGDTDAIIKGDTCYVYDSGYSENVTEAVLTTASGTVLKLYFDVDSSYQPPARQHTLTYVNDGATLGTEQHAAGAQFTMPDADVTLTAVWEPNYGFSVVKVITSGTNNVKSGDLVDYKVTITNTSPVKVYDMWVEDTMDTGLALEGEVHYTVNGGTQVYTMSEYGRGETGTGTLYVWEPQTRLDLEPGDFITLTYQARVTVTEEATLHNLTEAYAYKNDPTATQSVAAWNSYPGMTLSAVMPLVGGDDIIGGGDGQNGGTSLDVNGPYTGKEKSDDALIVSGSSDDGTGTNADVTAKPDGGTGEEPNPTTKPSVHYKDNADGDDKYTEEIGDNTTAKNPGDVGVTVPDGKELDYWLGSDGNTYEPGDEIPVGDDLTLTAQWKDKTPDDEGEDPTEPEDPEDPEDGETDIPEEDPPWRTCPRPATIPTSGAASP